jgi:DNA-binding beta-propeller fold protein YncE
MTMHLLAIGTTAVANQLDGYYVPVASTSGSNPESSSISLLTATGGDGTSLIGLGSVYEGHPLDPLNNVGDTHPSAMAIVRRGPLEVLYITKLNSDSIGMIVLNNNRKLPDFDLSPVRITGLNLHGAYPNAIVVSPDNTRAYVAEAGINSVAVLDTTNPASPTILGRIPTSWYPTALSLTPDGQTLFVANAKGVGEDINPSMDTGGSTAPPTGVVYTPPTDSNYIFGSLQKINLATLTLNNTAVLGYNYAINTPSDTSIVPVGDGPSGKIKHVFFVLHENKTFDSMLGNLGNRFGNFASTIFNNVDGSPYTNVQYTGVDLNYQKIANAFATAANYYSNSEESDAGHQFCMSGTSTDYTQKTLLVKSGRGILVNKNFEPEDYPESGYIFNNAARNRVSFKEYGVIIRLVGSDTGTSTPTTLNDPPSGLAGYPVLASANTVTTPLVNAGDVDSPVSCLEQTYWLSMAEPCGSRHTECRRRTTHRHQLPRLQLQYLGPTPR